MRQTLVRFLGAFPLLLGLFAGQALAQSTAATIRGTVQDEGENPVAGAVVTAVNTETGFRHTATAGASGSYSLAGLRPGTYAITVSALGRAPQTRTLQVLVGQSLTADFQLTTQAVALEGITIAGGRAVETRTSEVATNVTREQIESLPQQDRNFLNFAGLAPGVTVSRDEMNKTISAGGLPATKINVFVDGASLKNDILEGGISGQDASRGNPFPQIAVREFRVITQNFKAEYQRAASAVITAATRSGTNRFEVDGFLLGQNKGLVEQDAGAVLLCREAQERNEACRPKPEYERLQAGLAVGGPVIRDRLHFFLGYEGNYQNREAQVVVGRPEFRDRFGQYEGSFDQPFRSHLGFGKLSFQPTDEQLLELSWNGRFESDKRGFGGTTSFESAEDVRIGHNILNLQHTFSRGDWVNQAQISGQRSTWNPTAVNDDQDIGLEFGGIIRIGARDTEQKFVQDRIAFRDDVTYSGLRWAGDHVLKGGINVDFLHYDVEKRFAGNPIFFFDPAVSLDVPVRAFWGEGNPGMDESNTQFGAFIQDDWDVTDQLQLNLGLRWDAETNLFNNNWVTPDSVRQAFAGLGFEDRFTRGREDRPIFLGAFQPRLGFSYDVFDDGETVVHGGFGVYYDREIWNHLLDERFRLQWRFREFNFTTTGEPGKIPWRPEYLSREGLQSIVNAVNPFATSEVFLLENDARPPRSNQWNLGIRQVVRDFVLGAAYRGVRGYNVMSWYCGIPHSEHGYCGGGSERGLPFSPVLSTDEGRTWYDALDLTLEKPITEESRWGATLTYTLADAERKGQTFFTLDHPDVDPADWPVVDANLERHRLVASGIVSLPLDIMVSTIAQFGSGIPFNRVDETLGWGPRRARIEFASQDPPNFRQVDLRLQKNFDLPGTRRVGLLLEAINVFNDENFREYEGLAVFSDRSANPRFGQPLWWTADPGRRLQIGINVGS